MKFYTVKDVAKLLDLNKETIKRYIWSEQLIAYKVANEWRIKEEDLEAFIYREPNKKVEK